ncbi:MAG: DUF1289 domain-containing protein [Pseudomonadales bacterium]|nr:DUF1289 domain-containing protein [Pseudomonadales bacterium]
MFKKKESADIEKPVASPCVSICALDENDVCIGCHRCADEIVAWGKMDNQQRRDTLRKSEQRGRDAGAYFS